MRSRDCHVWSGSVHTMSQLVLCVTIVILLMTPAALAELMFHLRSGDDHQPKSPTKARTVANKQQAKIYLSKYGYLECNEGGPSSPDLPTGETCSDEDIRQGLIKLQRHFKIPETGKFDELTRRTMNKERCGNADSEIPEGRVKLTAPSRAATLPTLGPVPRGDSKVRESSRNVGAPRGRRSISRAVAPSILDVIRSPRIAEAPYTGPHRQFFDRDTKRSMIKNDLRNKIERRKRRSGNAFADAVDLYVQKHKRRQWRRQRRSVVEDLGRQFNIEDGDITWELPEQFYSSSLPEGDQRHLLWKAFRMWGEVIPAVFKENSVPDVTLRFGTQGHSCTRPFDGQGGEISHSWSAGDIHFDDDEYYTFEGHQGFNFFKIAMHEIGHVLGLGHTESEHSIMYPLFNNDTSDMFGSNAPIELPFEDRRYVQSVYGVCKGTFNEVFDWLRREPPYDNPRPRYIFNTYFFRDDHYWMYENMRHRPRLGDPLHIQPHWDGIPGKVDAYVQTRTAVSDHVFDIKTYFFKGSLVYLYDDVALTVAPGWPKKISEVFGPKPGSREGVPGNLDAAYFDMDEQTIYFFKDQWVWKYPVEDGPDSCCDEKITFSEMFEEQSVTTPINGYIDTVYFSFNMWSAYIFKGERVYQMVKRPGGWRLAQLPEPWYAYWYDICNVE